MAAFFAKRGTTMPPNLGDDRSDTFSGDSTLKMAAPEDAAVDIKQAERPRVSVFICLVLMLLTLGITVAAGLCFLNHMHLMGEVASWADEGRIAPVTTSVHLDGLGKRQMYTYGQHPTINSTVVPTSSFGSATSATTTVSGGISYPIVTISLTDQSKVTVAPSSQSGEGSGTTLTITSTDGASTNTSGTTQSTSASVVTVVNTRTVVPVPASNTTASVETGKPSNWNSSTSGWNSTLTSSATADENMTVTPTTATTPKISHSSLIVKTTTTTAMTETTVTKTESSGATTFSVDAVTASMPQNGSMSMSMSPGKTLKTRTTVTSTHTLTVSPTDDSTCLTTVSSSSTCTETAASQSTTSTGDAETESPSFSSTTTETFIPHQTTRVTVTVPAMSTLAIPSISTTVTMTETGVTKSIVTTKISTETATILPPVMGTCDAMAVPTVTVTATVVQTMTVTLKSGGFSELAVSNPEATTTQEATASSTPVAQSPSATGILGASISPRTSAMVGIPNNRDLSTSTSCNGTTVTAYLNKTTQSVDAITNPEPTTSSTLMSPSVSNLTISDVGSTIYTTMHRTIHTTFTVDVTGVFGTGRHHRGNTTVYSTIYGGGPIMTTVPAISGGDKTTPPRTVVIRGPSSCVVMLVAVAIALLI